MEICTIAKDFQSALKPTSAFSYEDLPALELNMPKIYYEKVANMRFVGYLFR
jgi:hypothetical protein